MTTDASVEVSGLDGLGNQIILHRLPILHAHFSRWLEEDGQSALHLLRPDNHILLIAWFEQFESRIKRLSSNDLSALRNGLNDWLTNYLLPLARDLELRPLGTEHVFVLLYNQGVFDLQQLRGSPKLPNTRTKSLKRPPAEDVIPQVRRVMGAFSAPADQKHELIRRGLCRDDDTAYYMVQAFDFDRKDSPLYRIAIKLTRGIILSFLTHNAIGLLANSVHPCSDILLNLEGRRKTIALLTEQPDAVLAVLRADLLALHEALIDTPISDGQAKRGKNERKQYGERIPYLWREDLLYLPSYSIDRQEYRARITPEQWITLAAKLAGLRGCSQDEAQQSLEILTSNGLDGLIDWRCTSPNRHKQDTLHFLRLGESIERHLSGFHPDARRKISEMLRVLVTLIDELHIPLNLAPLLDAQSASRKRAKFASRVPYHPYAAPRLVSKKLKSSLKPKRRWGYRPPRDPKVAEFRAVFSMHIDQLARAFGVRVGLDELQARARLRALGDYGGIGLLPKRDWPDALDPRLVSYIYFLKFGPISGTLSEAVMLMLVNAYTEEIGVPAISMQIARAIFSTQVKERRWNGGVGDSMIGVRQRPSLKLSKTGLLNLIWRLIPVRLNLQIAKSADSRASGDCYAIIVLELSSQRPVGCWVSVDPFHIEQVGLALFQAVWHPGIPDWPLRGLPNIIQIPRSLVAGESVEAIERAAYRMHAKVQVVDDDTKRALLRKLAYAENLLQQLIPFDGCAFIREKANSRPLPIRYVQDRLMEWLRFGRRTDTSPGCFPNHRSPDVPLAFRKNGFTLPAHDNSAAGWLLPVVDTTKTVRDGVRFNDRLYSGPSFRAEPGVEVKIRTFPYRYSLMPQSIFVERNGGRLVYLTIDREEV